MSVGRFASAIVVGMTAGGLTAMSGIGRHDMVAVAIEAPATRQATTAPAAAGAKPVLTPVDPR